MSDILRKTWLAVYESVNHFLKTYNLLYKKTTKGLCSLLSIYFIVMNVVRYQTVIVTPAIVILKVFSSILIINSAKQSHIIAVFNQYWFQHHTHACSISHCFFSFCFTQKIAFCSSCTWFIHNLYLSIPCFAILVSTLLMNNNSVCH